MNRGESYYTITGGFVNNKKVIEHMKVPNRPSVSKPKTDGIISSKPKTDGIISSKPKTDIIISSKPKTDGIISSKPNYKAPIKIRANIYENLKFVSIRNLKVSATNNIAEAATFRLNIEEDTSFLTYKDGDKLYILYTIQSTPKLEANEMRPSIDASDRDFFSDKNGGMFLELVTDDIKLTVNAKNNKWIEILDKKSWSKYVLFNSSSSVIIPRIKFDFINTDTNVVDTWLSPTLNRSDGIRSTSVVRTPSTSSTSPVNNIQETMNIIQEKIVTLEEERNKCYIDIKTSCPPGYKCIPSNIWKDIAKGIDGMDIMIEDTQILDGDSLSTNVNITEISN